MKKSPLRLKMFPSDVKKTRITRVGSKVTKVLPNRAASVIRLAQYNRLEPKLNSVLGFLPCQGGVIILIII